MRKVLLFVLIAVQIAVPLCFLAVDSNRTDLITECGTVCRFELSSIDYYCGCGETGNGETVDAICFYPLSVQGIEAPGSRWKYREVLIDENTGLARVGEFSKKRGGGVKINENNTLWYYSVSPDMGKIFGVRTSDREDLFFSFNRNSDGFFEFNGGAHRVFAEFRVWRDYSVLTDFIVDGQSLSQNLIDFNN